MFLPSFGAASPKHPWIGLEDPLLTAFLHAPEPDQFLGKLAFDATPSTDDRPYFFYNLRLGDLPRLFSQLSSTEINNLGVAILLFLLVLSTALTFAFVLVPLALVDRKSPQPRALSVLAYFSALGVGFILVELGFMQTFVLFLGHPVYALAVVLSGLLIATAAGSAWSNRGVARHGVFRFTSRTGGALALVLLAYAIALSPVLRSLLGLPLSLRILIALLLVGVPGVFMGTMLPSGVRVAAVFGRRTVAWAWGLNGAASVLGSVLALVVAMNFGHTSVLVAGIVTYVLGLAALSRAVQSAEKRSLS